MEIRYYDKELDIDGTCAELVRSAWLYDATYSDKALLAIYEIAVKENDPKKNIPLLVLKGRARENDEEIPYEQILASALYYGEDPKFSKTMPYGELEIMSENGYTVISISGVDDYGSFTAANSVPTSVFTDVGNDMNYLENLIGQTLFYGKEYQE